MTRSLALVFLLAVVSTNAMATGTGAAAENPPAPGSAAQPSPASAALGQDEQLILVVHTAEDCPVCKVWRESPSGLPVAKSLPQQWPHLQLVLIERKRLYGSEAESLYPPDLQYLYEARRERYQLSPPVPLFEIVRREQVIARQGGLQGWTDGILPSLHQLEASRAGPARQADVPSRQQ